MKIKEKEKQKKVNKKKREEKEAKEKERKRTCGKEGVLAEPTRWKSSQRGIGDFLEKVNVDTGTGGNFVDYRRGETPQDEVVAEDQKEPDTEVSAAKEESHITASRVSNRPSRLSSDRKPLRDLSFNSVRPPLPIPPAETKSHNCSQVWDDDWAALVASNAQIARELNSPDVDDVRGHELSRQRPSLTKHNTSQITPKDLPSSATQTSALLPARSDQGIPFISTQDLRLLEEDLEEMERPSLKRKATGPPTASSPNQLISKDIQRPTKRFKPKLSLEPSHPSALVNEQPPRPARLPDDSTVPAATQYGLISTQDLLELDLGLTEPSPAKPQPPQISQKSFNFGEDEITDEDLLGLDIPESLNDGPVH